jgi:hypothetical protein
MLATPSQASNPASPLSTALNAGDSHGASIHETPIAHTSIPTFVSHVRVHSELTVLDLRARTKRLVISTINAVNAMSVVTASAYSLSQTALAFK